MKKKLREFIDIDRPVMDEYYDLLDRNIEPKTLETRMRGFIKKDPYFLDPYAILADLLIVRNAEEEALEIMAKAMDNALALILDKKDRWPDKMEWGWLQNRHIMRTLYNGATDFWATATTLREEEALVEGALEMIVMALEIFRNLLHSCPNDNLGVRYYIAAICEGMTFDEYEERFQTGMFVNPEQEPWFQECIKKYPDEFKDWAEQVE